MTDRKKAITEFVCKRPNGETVIRVLYTYGETNIDALKKDYIDRGFEVYERDYDVPNTEFGMNEMTLFLESYAYRFYERGGK